MAKIAGEVVTIASNQGYWENEKAKGEDKAKTVQGLTQESHVLAGYTGGLTGWEYNPQKVLNDTEGWISQLGMDRTKYEGIWSSDKETSQNALRLFLDDAQEIVNGLYGEGTMLMNGQSWREYKYGSGMVDGYAVQGAEDFTGRLWNRDYDF